MQKKIIVFVCPNGEIMKKTINRLKNELESAQSALSEAKTYLLRQDAKLDAADKEVKETQKRIEQAYKEWMNALDILEDAFFMHDKDFRILRCNKAYQRYAGLPFKQIIGQRYFDIFPKTHSPLHSCLQAAEKQLAEGIAEEVQVGDSIFHSHAYAITDTDGQYIYSVHTLVDITRHKQNEDTLREREAFIKTILDNLPIGIAVNTVAPSVTFKYMNDNFPRIYRTTREKLDATPDAFWNTVYEDSNFREEIKNKVVNDSMSTDIGRMNWVDIPIIRKGEETTFITARNVPLPDKEYMISMVWDVSESKKTESKLRESEKKYRLLFESSRDALMTLSPPSWTFTDANKATLKLFGANSLEEFTALEAWNFSPERQADGCYSKEKSQEYIALALREGSHFFEWNHQRLDGQLFTADVSLTRMYTDGNTFLQATVRDITERKESEKTLKRINRTLKTLSAGNMALVRAQSEDELLQKVTKIIVDQAGYNLAVVDYAEDNPKKRIIPIAWSGLENNHYRAKDLSWSYTGHNQSPVSKTIRSTTTQVCHDIQRDSEFYTWRDAALARGYVSSIALPLSSSGKTFGALNIYSSEKNAFDNEEVQLLEELANDLAYGIITLRTRIAHEQHANILRESLEQSIQTIAATVEARDPYTAGHQERVSELATAIAQEMGLSEEQINGIHLAATIHDLGKIHIPSEILSRPGKLGDIEFMLIKTHPQAGYDILKNIKFPWPIADIILQHHEKLDGSGYPQGLKGNQILLESKILTVADVVEAMSSHRPYRPALGIELALNEIKLGRGKTYGASVVDACLKLFEKGFAFSNEPA